MKRQVNKQGFVMVLLIFFIAVIGLETGILSSISNTMAFETNQAYLHACRENLVISGLAWAKENANRGSANESTDLDVESLGLCKAELKVTVSAARKEAGILASCSIARQRLYMNNTYEF